MLVAGKPHDLYDNLASTKKAAKSRDRAIAKESRTALTGSLLERLIAATTLNRIAPSYTHVLQDQIGAGEKTYAMSQRESGLDERMANRLKSRVDRSKMGTSSVRPAFMGEADIMMDPYVRAESAEGLAGQGYTGYTGTFETSFGESYDMTQRDLSFANPIDPYVAQEQLGVREARQTAQLFGYGGGSGGVSGGVGGRVVQASMGETDRERMARAMRKIPGAVYDVNADKWLLPNTREYDAFMSQQTQAQNPFASGAYEVMYGGGGGAAFDAMDGGGFFQEQDETQAYYQGILSQVMEASRQGVETFSGAYSRLGEVPPEMRPLPSEELVAYRSQSEEIAPEEREAFREYLRRNPRGTFTEFRDPRAFVSIQGGSLEQLDPSTPMSFASFNPSEASSASTLPIGRGGTLAQQLAQQERRKGERDMALLLTSMVADVSQDPDLFRALAEDKGYSFKGLMSGKAATITKKPKKGGEKP
jgi:hypothetical protein